MDIFNKTNIEGDHFVEQLLSEIVGMKELLEFQQLRDVFLF